LFKQKLEGRTDVGPQEITVLAMIKSLDDNVGQLVNAVKELGIEEETIIIFTSDNGHYKTEHNIFDHPYRGTKGETLEGGICVPYIFTWKNHIPPKTVSKEPIIHVDIYLTIMGLTHTAYPEGYILDGEDLTPILFDASKKTNRDALVWEYINHANYNDKAKKFRSEWVNVIQMYGYKLTEYVEDGCIELYNLNNDPYETNEISAQEPMMVKKLQSRLKQWKNETGYKEPVENPAYLGNDIL
jgi:arylsulfatase A-like enzyme